MAMRKLIVDLIWRLSQRSDSVCNTRARITLTHVVDFSCIISRHRLTSVRSYSRWRSIVRYNSSGSDGKTRFFFHTYIYTRCLGFPFYLRILWIIWSRSFPGVFRISEKKISILIWSRHPCVKKRVRNLCDIPYNIARRDRMNDR